MSGHEPPFTVYGQSLSSVLNDPSRTHRPQRVPPSAAAVAAAAVPLPAVSEADFAQYVRGVQEDARPALVTRASQRATADFVSARPPVKRLTEAEQAAAAAAAAAAWVAPSLSTVPAVFFEPRFSMRSPAVFERVVGGAYDFPPLLQQALTAHTDDVEVDLVRQIALRTHGFFAALSHLHELNAQVARVGDGIDALGGRLEAVRATSVRAHLVAPALTRQRARLHGVRRLLRMVAAVRATQPTVETLLLAADFTGALDLIAGTQRLLLGELRGVRALQPVLAVLGEQEARIVKLIQQRFESVCDRFQRRDVQMPERGVRASDSGDDGGNDNSSSDDDNDDNDDAAAARRGKAEGAGGAGPWEAVADGDGAGWRAELEDTLMPLVVALLRLGKLQVALQSYRERLLAGTKLAVMQTVERVATDEGDARERPVEGSEPGIMNFIGGNVDVARFKPALFRRVLDVVFTDMMGKLRVSRAVHEIVLGVLAAAADRKAAAAAAAVRGDGTTPTEEGVASSPTPGADASNDGEASGSDGDASGSERGGGRVVSLMRVEDLPASYGGHVAADSLELLYSLCELCHVRVSRLFKMRADTHVHLPPEPFAALYAYAQRFVAESERVCGKQCYGLRPTLLGQAKQFVATFHANKMSQLALILEAEAWAPVSAVPDEFQALVDSFTRPVPTTTPAAAATATAAATAAPAKRATTTVTVDGTAYHVVQAELLLLKMVADYLALLRLVPSRAPDVLHKLTEVLLLFNSRTCQLVLGAGAMHVMQLKSITAKHLALSAQCLSLQLVLLPHLRSLVALHVPANKRRLLATDMDRVQRDYEEHRHEIYAKFVYIIRERLGVHGAALRQHDWNRKETKKERKARAAAAAAARAAGDDSEDAGYEPPPYLAALFKEAATLRRVLAKWLPPADVQHVFVRIAAAIGEGLQEAYTALELTSDRAVERLHADVRYVARACKRDLGVDGGAQLQQFADNVFSRSAEPAADDDVDDDDDVANATVAAAAAPAGDAATSVASDGTDAAPGGDGDAVAAASTGAKQPRVQKRAPSGGGGGGGGGGTSSDPAAPASGVAGGLAASWRRAGSLAMNAASAVTEKVDAASVYTYEQTLAAGAAVQKGSTTGSSKLKAGLSERSRGGGFGFGAIVDKAKGGGGGLTLGKVGAKTTGLFGMGAASAAPKAATSAPPHGDPAAPVSKPVPKAAALAAVSKLGAQQASQRDGDAPATAGPAEEAGAM